MFNLKSKVNFSNLIAFVSSFCSFLQPHSSLDEDDPNILLAIQLSLQESGLPMGGGGGTVDTQELLAHEASLGAIGSSLPSRLDPLLHGVDIPRTALSSSELLELEDSLKKLGNMSGQNVPQRFNNLGNPIRESTGSPFNPSFGHTNSAGLDPADNANLLGNIMAWFHDMNPQNIGLVPSATSLEPEFGSQLGSEQPAEKPFQPWTAEGDLEACEYSSADQREPVRPTQLDLVSVEVPCATSLAPSTGETLSTSQPCHSDSTKCVSDPEQPSSSSSEWEGQVHLV